ncbi:AraC family transcriptional regulator ligand-binding domain-containing protein [Fretibacter rubidus]|uniref:AraC family transcriptional regulator ligand-binding domain-containing protein n=1 Tax=Fretibacter rubidus TaxID=570162 RepID=UPI00352A54C0
MAFAAIYFSSLVDIIAGEGWPRDGQLLALGVTEGELSDPSQRIDNKTVADHFEHAAQILDCPHIAILMGYKFRVATFVETGSVLAYADSLVHAGRLNARYQRLAESSGIGSVAYEDEQIYLRWAPNFDDDNHYRRLTEVIFAGYVTTVRWLAWVYRKDFVGLSFRHEKPDYADKYSEILQCPVQFSQTHNQLQFYPETAELSLPTSNPQKLAIVTERLDRILMGAKADTDLMRRVKAAIRTVIKSGRVTLIDVAKLLEMTDRTLRRQLKEQGVSFRDVVDDVRKRQFDRLVRDGHTLTQIAHILGYNDQSAFTRAFRRWYGMSPTLYLTNTQGDTQSLGL